MGNQNTNTISDVSDDWDTIPFVSVRVTDNKCSSTEESLFKRVWGGTEMGCLVNKLDTWGYGSSQVVMSNSEYDSYTSTRTTKNNSRYRQQQREPCMPISMQSPVVQDEFYDMRFCGKRAGAPFSTAIRP